MLNDDWYQSTLYTGGRYRERPGEDGLEIFFRWHQEDEPYVDRDEIVPLLARKGMRSYCMAKLGVLIPNIILMVPLYPVAERIDNEIGQVSDVRTEGYRFHELGSAQAWYYPVERVIILWEVLPHFHTQPQDLQETILDIWQAFARTLWEKFPHAHGMATTSFDPAYDDAQLAAIHAALCFGQPPAEQLVQGKAQCVWAVRPSLEETN